MALLDVSRLTPPTRRLVQDAGYRAQLTANLLRSAPSSVEAVTARDAIDAAVVEILAATGLPRGPINGPIVERYGRGWYGRKAEDCRLLIDIAAFSLIPLSAHPDSLVRTWVHESLHARQPYSSGYSREWRETPGYEEGLAETLTHTIVVEGLGLAPSIASYRLYVVAYRTLATALGIEVEHLLRALWHLPAGELASGFWPVVERILMEQQQRALSHAQRARLAILAHRYFAADRLRGQPDEAAMTLTWERAIG